MRQRLAKHTLLPVRSREPHKRVLSPENVFHPCDDALKRFEAIPLVFDRNPGAVWSSGEIVYDSWAEGPPVGLRRAVDGHIRLLRLKAGRITLELVAERRRLDWGFVARVYHSRQVAHDFVLQVGRRRLLADSGGYYQWTTSLVPRTIRLLSHRGNLAFERLSWQ